MNMDFYNTVLPLIEKEMDNVLENYDEVMVSLISFISATLLENTIANVNAGNVDIKEFERHLGSQIKKTVNTIIDSSVALHKAYSASLKDGGQLGDFDVAHPTVQ